LRAVAGGFEAGGAIGAVGSASKDEDATTARIAASAVLMLPLVCNHGRRESNSATALGV
jgi:hypothetical protein